MDPYKGVIRWSLQRALDHFRGILATVIIIPALSAVIAQFVALPAKPTRAYRIENALVVLVLGVLFVAALACLYALLLAPYEQRGMLRTELTAKRAELDQIEDSLSETLTLEDLEQTRTAPSQALPAECSRLQLAIAFRNDADVPLKYSMKEASVELAGSELALIVSVDRFRIAAGHTGKCLAYIDINPPLAGPMIGILRYRAWYGPLTDPEMYEQQHSIYFTNNSAPIGLPINYSFVQLAGGHDKLRSL
jgi:hypothetical protein